MPTFRSSLNGGITQIKSAILGFRRTALLCLESCQEMMQSLQCKSEAKRVDDENKLEGYFSERLAFHVLDSYEMQALHHKL